MEIVVKWLTYLLWPKIFLLQQQQNSSNNYFHRLLNIPGFAFINTHKSAVLRRPGIFRLSRQKNLWASICMHLWNACLFFQTSYTLGNRNWKFNHRLELEILLQSRGWLMVMRGQQECLEVRDPVVQSSLSPGTWKRHSLSMPEENNRTVVFLQSELKLVCSLIHS